MLVSPDLARVGPLRQAVRDLHCADEAAVVGRLIEEARMPPDARERIAARATSLVEEVRRERLGQGGLDAFLHEFELSSREGVVLMCLAEALLRVPDAETVDKLIADKIAEADWEAHLGRSDSLFVNASTWALMLTGRVISVDERAERDLGQMGRTIGEALERARPDEAKGYRYSYDMLGEAARTMADAERYFASYQGAIKAIGKAAAGRGPIDSPGISVKLSALHPRYEFAQRDRVLGELLPRLEALAAEARDQGIGLTVDAEEADRLDLSLDVIEAVSGMPGLKGWDGLGFVVQTYLKRSGAVVDYLADMAEGHGRRLMVRLVKGAYWDSEIKHAQELGFDGYPVFTRKVSTDVSYLAAARKLMAVPRAFYPQFATHNAHSLATVLELAGEGRDFEFQRLHGMGEVLYRQVVGRDKLAVPCRIYAPVGGHEELLAYLVRRLLENGANSSFVNRIQDEKLPIEEIVADPVAKAQALEEVAHPRIPLPAQLFGEARRNSKGLDLTEVSVVVPLGEAMETAAGKNWRGGRSSGPMRPWLAMRSRAPRKRPGVGTRRRPTSGPPAWSVWPTLWRREPAISWPFVCARPERRRATPSPRSARRSTSAATMRCARAAISPAPRAFRVPPASATRSRCMAAASSCASAHGTSRWPSSPGRSPQRWPPATR
jgi:RHH-type proline utilization regulon transcriptional repressor/proline dehydrogenase/delta 1-pyrroline-5-carboxylate dehydrogenase